MPVDVSADSIKWIAFSIENHQLSDQDLDTDLVVLDEAHFIGDPDRGIVWEEVIIYLPPRVPLLLLSATIGNADQLAGWMAEEVRGSRPGSEAILARLTEALFIELLRLLRRKYRPTISHLKSRVANR